MDPFESHKRGSNFSNPPPGSPKFLKNESPDPIPRTSNDIDLIQIESPVRNPSHNMIKNRNVASRLLNRKSSHSSPSRQNKSSALLVDDVKVTQMVTRAALHQAGFHCDVTGDGHAAVKMAKKISYKVILMDVQLPILDGVEATKQIRAFEAQSMDITPSIIFGLTGNCEEPQLQTYNEAGMDGCIQKGCVVSRAMHEALAMHKENPDEFIFINSRNVQSIRKRSSKTSVLESKDAYTPMDLDGAMRIDSPRQLVRLESPASSSMMHSSCQLRHSALLVDDVKITQKITSMALKKTGYACDSASDGYSAVQMAKAKEYDIILMDVQMPGLDGVQATKIIREFEQCSQRSPSTILGLTGNCSDEALGSYADAGMDGCIEKGCVVSRAMHEAVAILDAYPDQFVFIDSQNIQFGLSDSPCEEKNLS